MIEAYTTAYLPMLGDWNNKIKQRKVILTRYDGRKYVYGVVEGLVTRLKAREVFKASGVRFTKRELKRLYD